MDEDNIENPRINLVKCPHCPGNYRPRGLNNHIRAAHPQHQNQCSQNQALIDEPNDEEVPDFIQNVFINGFGAPLVNKIGNIGSIWDVRWMRAMKLKGKQYSLPQGAIGRRFVSTLAEIIQAVANGVYSSERIFFHCSTILQRETSVTSGSDIRKLISNRIDLWMQERYDELLHKAERCDKKFKKFHGVMDEGFLLD